MINKTKTIAAYILSVLVILAAWVFVSKLINAELILPSPLEVFSSMAGLVKTKAFWQAFTHTFLRVIISFAITVVLGTAIGIAAGFSKFLRDFFELPLAIIRATPVVAFILIALFWFKSGTVPVFVLGMAKVFCFSRRQIFKYIQFPSLVPFLLNGMVSSFGLTWKVVAAGEVLSLPKYAAGTMLQKAQIHLETSTVIAVAIILVLVSFVIERLFMYAVKRISSSL